MKKKREILFPFGDEMQIRLRKMKLTVLLTFFVLASFGNGFSQATLSLHFNKANIREVLSSIEKKTDYIFMYKDYILSDSKEISVDFHDAKFEEVLKSICNQSNVDYEVRDRQIILKERTFVSGLQVRQQQQNKDVSGTVKDSKGLPLPGVTVVVKGTTIGTVTDNYGKFSLVVSADTKSLSFSFVGMKTQEITLGSNSTFNVTLTEQVLSLEEVVTIGFGTAKRKDVVGDISKITSKDLGMIPSTNLAQSMQGMASGLMVTNTTGAMGAPSQVLIRGINSLNLSTDPLWIIDGVPVSNQGAGQIAGYTPSTSPMAMINPSDVESINILKDAVATAIYGNRASNGVIIITTKSNKDKATALNVNYDGGVNFVPFKQNDIFVDSKTYFTMADEAWKNAGNTGQFPTLAIFGDKFFGTPPSLTHDQAINVNIDQLKQYTQPSRFDQFSLTAQKGYETGGIMFSCNYRNEEGIIRNNNLKRLTSRFNFNFKPVSFIEVGVNNNFLYTNTDGVSDGKGRGSVGGWGSWFETMPWFPIYDSTNSTGYWYPNSGYNFRAASDRKLNKGTNENIRNISNSYLDIATPLKGLTVHGDAGVDFATTNLSTFQSAAMVGQSPYVSSASEAAITKGTFNFDMMINYNRIFKDAHKLDVVIGNEGNRTWGYLRSASGRDITSIYPQLLNPSIITGAQGSEYQTISQMGLFGRLNYNYKSKYIFNGSIRRDGHSALSKDNRWADFLAGGVGWLVSEENFFTPVKNWVSTLKLRATFGQTGNANLSPNMLVPQWYTNNYSVWGINYQPYSTQVGPVGDANLKWETSNNLDLGLDFGLLSDRVNGSVTYYKKSTKNLILLTVLPSSVGYTQPSMWQNVGNLDNWGWEFNVSSMNLKTKDFKWSSALNISTNNNKVTKLDAQESGKGSLSTINPGLMTTIRKVGEKIGTYYASNFAGVDPQLGCDMIQQRDAAKWSANNITVATGKLIPMTQSNYENNQMIQNGKTALPTWYGGFSNTFTYKAFDLNLMFTAAGGNWLVDDQLVYRTHFNLAPLGKELVGNYWKKPGDIAKYPQIVYHNNYQVNNLGVATPGSYTQFVPAIETTESLSKGDYLKIKSLILGYTLPKSISMKAKLSLVRIYAGAMNLFTFTRYTGLDPETLNGIPQQRSINFGVTVTL